jgi:DNA-damage-inducible protein D
MTEQLKLLTQNGAELWSARDLVPLMNYKDWRNFLKVIQKAQQACEASGHETSDHFVGANKMVSRGSGFQRELDDFHFTSHGSYPVICQRRHLPTSAPNIN